MGDIKRKRRLYSRPRKLFDTDRIQEENIIVNEYGLKNKREIWKAKSVATKFRQRAKRLISKDDEEKRAFIVKLNTLGLKVENISEVLALTEKDVLERRLQTVLFRKGMAHTAKQARQIIVHKYVLINSDVVNTPSFWVTPELENKISVKPKKEKAVIAETAPTREPALEQTAEAKEEIKKEANE
jgi:small subunit ribosomal protein S4